MSYTEQIDFSRIPQHVAIIMDGNGRWAKQRGRERSLDIRPVRKRCMSLQKKQPEWASSI